MPTWADRNPHPGDPPPHPGREPAGGPELEVWWLNQSVWNQYVMRERLHRIARGVDQLLTKEGTPSYGRPTAGLEPHEEIALLTGLMFLDGSTVLARR